MVSVSKLPLYTFKIDREHPIEDGNVNVNVNSSEELPQVFFLHNLLLGQWEDRMRRGLFRYDVTNCETKVIPGKYGFIAQLNEGRHLKKRLTEFRIDQVLQPFDDSKFNFTKVGQEEVLFRFEPSNDNKSHFFPSADIASDLNSPSVIAINVSTMIYNKSSYFVLLLDFYMTLFICFLMFYLDLCFVFERILLVLVLTKWGMNLICFSGEPY